MFGVSIIQTFVYIFNHNETKKIVFHSCGKCSTKGCSQKCEPRTIYPRFINKASLLNRIYSNLDFTHLAFRVQALACVSSIYLNYMQARSAGDDVERAEIRRVRSLSFRACRVSFDVSCIYTSKRNNANTHNRSMV